MSETESCPDCGAPATAGPEPPTTGSERARPFQWVRWGARYLSCPDHGPYSVAEETVDGENVDLAVFRDDPNPDSYVVLRNRL